MRGLAGRDVLRGVVRGAVLGLVAITSGCKDEQSADGEVLASQAIGPEGGSISAKGLTVTVPAGALTAETEVEIRTTTTRLGELDWGFEQQGDSLAVFPDGLELRLPAELTYDSDQESPAVLFEQDGLVVASVGARGITNEFGIVALAKAGVPRTTILEPTLAPTLAGDGESFRDVAHLRFETTQTPRLNLVFTIYDPAAAYDKPLNGTTEGDCGFKIEDVLGGSLSAGCAEGPLTAQVRVTSEQIEFDVLPFLAGKMETPVKVGVVAGSDELAYQLGFFSFDTSACYEENCSGRGTCEVQGDGAVCVCEEGYAADGLACECVPNCEGRECGYDGCNGQCPPGCVDGETCSEEGQCVGGGEAESGDSGDSGDSSGGESTDGGETDSGTDSGGASTGPGTSGSSSTG